MSRARSVSRLGNENNLIVTSSGNVGVGSTLPSQKLQVGGTVSATSFVGSGTSLTGITGKAAAMTIVFG